MLPSHHSFRGQSVQTLCGCNAVPHCDQHRLEQLQRACHAHSITKCHASRQWRHEQQLSSIGLRRQVLRSCGTSRSLYLSQSRSGPGVRILFVDDGELQFLCEFGEISSFFASDKGVVFFDNDDMQRGEAQTTYKSGDFDQFASFSLPTQVAELVTDLSNLAPQVFHMRLQVCLDPSQHTLTSSPEWLAGKQKNAYCGCLRLGECWCFCFLLSPYQIGWSPERLSTCCTTSCMSFPRAS